jgi:hypothetical protein
MSCCAGCKSGEECASYSNDAEPMESLIGSFSPVSVSVHPGLASGEPFTLLDARIECQTKDYDGRISKAIMNH